MAEEVRVSFVVIAYNEVTNIGRTLSTIVGLGGLAGHEIIVVDDGSCDGTDEVVTQIAERNPSVHLIRLPRNRGRGYARHTGIAAARGQLIATVDADILLPPDWLVRSCAALRRHDAVGGTALPDGDVAYLYRRFRLVPRLVGHTTSVTGSNALYRREVFEHAGFDPALREGEDSALNYAMEQRGFSLATVPGLLVRHEENKSLPNSVRWLFNVGRGATRQLLTYHDVRQPDLIAGSFFCTVALGALAAAIAHQFIPLAFPLFFLLAVGALHVRSRFEMPPSQWRRAFPAVAIDSLLLLAYFVGRLAGLVALKRRN